MSSPKTSTLRVDATDALAAFVGALFSSAKLVLYRAAYGGAVLGPYFCFGRNFSIRVRNGGAFKFERMRARDGFRVFCDGGAVAIGDGCFFNNGCSLNSMAGVTIGRSTLFGENVKIYDHDHALGHGYFPRKDSFEKAAVSIGSNCWIGSNVVILKGVTIVDGVTVAAGAVVTKSILQSGVYASKSLAKVERIG